MRTVCASWPSRVRTEVCTRVPGVALPVELWAFPILVVPAASAGRENMPRQSVGMTGSNGGTRRIGLGFRTFRLT